MIEDSLNDQIIAGILAGRPTTGPLWVHVDVTNRCNTRCITCWSHSPLLVQPRGPAWKDRQLPLDRFEMLIDELAELGSVQGIVLSGMGEPFTHPDIYTMMAQIKERSWHLTVVSNLIAADEARLLAAGIDDLWVGVHGASPEAYTAFHPGLDACHFDRLAHLLDALHAAGTRTRHIQVIDRHTAEDLPQMVRFGHDHHAHRIHFTLPHLTGGTEAARLTPLQSAWLIDEGIADAKAEACALGMRTNLCRFERELCAPAAPGDAPDLRSVGCYMGHVFTRITVDLDVLFCCSAEVRVGSLQDAGFRTLWFGDAWQGLRERLAQRDFLDVCHRCGKVDQNRAWGARVAAAVADAEG